MYSYLTAFSTALIASLLATPVIREWAKRKGWVDEPDGKRKLHTSPIPRLGGIGLFVAVLLALIPISLLHTAVADYVRNNIRTLAVVLALAGLMVSIGVWDDLKNISPWKKLIAQCLVAFLCWFAGFRILEVWAGQHIQLWWAFSLPLTMLWIVLITNAFNLIDGMDGLAAGAALFATLAMLVGAVVGDRTLSALLLSAVTGAILGFLRYNFNPASIFLGDSGSLLLGFLLSLLAIRGSQKSTTAFAIAVPIVAFGLPVLDTALAIVRRFVRGKPIFSADGRHIHHLLLQRGLKPRHAVTVLYGICGLFGIFSLCFIHPAGKTNGVLLAILGVCIGLGIQQLRYSELRGLKGHLSRGIQNQRRLVAGSAVVEQMIDEMHKADSMDAVMRAIGSGLEELSFSRFELTLLTEKISIPMHSEKRWEVIPIATGGAVLRWTPLCRHCNRGRSKNHHSGNGNGSACRGCEALKNPILQNNIRMQAMNPVKPSAESEFAFPLYDGDGYDLGTAKFFYPSDDGHPISVIAILSQNMGKELKRSLQGIMNHENSGKKIDAGKWFKPKIAQPMRAEYIAKTIKST